VRPEARLTVVTTEASRTALAGLPEVDATLAFDKRWRPHGVATFARLALQLVRLRPDAAIAAQRSTRTGQLLWLTRAPLRVGFAAAPGAWAYHRSVAWDGHKHAVARYLDLAVPLGGDPLRADRRPRLAVDPRAAREARALLARAGIAGQRPFLCVAPGSTRATKRWTTAGFAEVVARVSGAGWPVVLAGTAAERPLCLDIAARSGVGPAVLAGHTTLSEFIALIALAAAVLANDSGSGHVAAAVDTPVLSVFGPSGPEMGYGPLGRDCRAVSHADLACRPCDAHGPRVCPLGHLRCMTDLGAERVFAALRELLGACAGGRQPAGMRPG
jgi:heptosyltransferase-2